MKATVLFLFLVATTIGCKKTVTNDPAPVPPTPTPIPTVDVTIDTGTFYPSSVVILTTSKAVTKDSVIASVGGKSTTLRKIDSLHLVLIVPAVTPGQYAVDLTAINATSNPSLKVGNYTQITDPTAVISGFSDSYSKALDTLKANTFRLAISDNDILFAKQLLSTIQQQSISFSEPEKLMVAYALQQINLDKTLFNPGPVNRTYTLTDDAPNFDEGAYQLQQQVKLTTQRSAEAKKANNLAVACILAALITPPPFNLALAAVALANSIKYFNLSASIKQSASIAENTAGVVSTFTPETTSFTTSPGIGKDIKITSGLFRTFQQSDVSNPNNAVAKELLQDEQDASRNDQSFTSVFDRLKSAISVLSSSISSTMSPFVSAIPQKAKEVIAKFKAKNLTVQNISNPDIQVFATDDGANSLSIAASNPKGNITTTTNYTVDAAYSQPFFGNTAKVTLQGTFSPQRQGTTVAGGNGIGSGANQFNAPNGVFVDGNGNIYVADAANQRIQKWSPGATVGVTVAGGNGQGSAANQFNYPESVAVDAAGNVYVADLNNHRIQKWLPGATAGITIIGKKGGGSGADQIYGPSDIYLDANGDIYIADGGNDRIQKWSHTDSTMTRVAGGNGRGSAANQFNNPISVVVDGAGNIYVSDANNWRIQKWSPGASSGVTVAGGNGQGTGDNQFYNISGIYIDNIGNLYVCDHSNFRVQMWAPGASKGVTVAFQSASSGFVDVFIDPQRNIYVADPGNSRIQKWLPF